jgi:hypothetical protein
VQHQKLASAHCVPGDRIELQSVSFSSSSHHGDRRCRQLASELSRSRWGGVMARSAPELSRPPRQGRSSQRRALGDGQLIVE